MAVIRCPACKAENAQGPTCRRCKADLSLLFRLEERRTWTLAEARRRLAAGRTDEADVLAGEADWMRSDAESRRMLALTRLMWRDFVGAWRCYHSSGVRAEQSTAVGADAASLPRTGGV